MSKRKNYTSTLNLHFLLLCGDNKSDQQTRSSTDLLTNPSILIKPCLLPQRAILLALKPAPQDQALALIHLWISFLLAFSHRDPGCLSFFVRCEDCVVFLFSFCCHREAGWQRSVGSLAPALQGRDAKGR